MVGPSYAAKVNAALVVQHKAMWLRSYDKREMGSNYAARIIRRSDSEENHCNSGYAAKP